MGDSVILVVCDLKSKVGKQLYTLLSACSELAVEALEKPENLLERLLIEDIACLVVDTVYYKELAGVEILLSAKAQELFLPPLLAVCENVKDSKKLFSHWPGFTDWLERPIDSLLLEKRVELLLGLCRLQNETASYKKELEARTLELEVLEQELLEKNFRLESLSSLDSLTGLFNNFYFDENLQKEWKQAARQGELLSLLLISIDLLGSYKERFGQEEGNELLRELAGVLHRTLLRPIDIVARYAGDQFAVLLPGTDTMGAKLVAERILKNVAAMIKVYEGGHGTVDVSSSIGGTTIRPSNGIGPADLMEQAEVALNKAKGSGGNRIVVEDSP